MLFKCAAMKRILLPIDFSENSWNASTCALSIYNKPEVHFYLLYLDHTHADHKQRSYDNDEIKVKLETWKGALQKKITSKTHIHSLDRGYKGIEDLRRIIPEKQIDFIVLSTSYALDTDHKSGESSVRDIITRIKCPLLLIPDGFKCKPIKELVLLSDFNFKHGVQATDTIVAFAANLKAHLNILELRKSSKTLSETQLFNKEYLQNALIEVPHNIYVVQDKPSCEALQFFINVMQVDVVILFAKHISLSEKIRFAPVQQSHINYHKTIPFLFIHE